LHRGAEALLRYFALRFLKKPHASHGPSLTARIDRRIVMDGMTGLEAAWRMREITQDAKIVFISSQFTTRDACGMARLFAGAFVSKSEAGKVLIPTIKRLLAMH